MLFKESYLNIEKNVLGLAVRSNKTINNTLICYNPQKHNFCAKVYYKTMFQEERRAVIKLKLLLVVEIHHFLFINNRRIRGIPTANEYIFTRRLLCAKCCSKGWGIAFPGSTKHAS